MTNDSPSPARPGAEVLSLWREVVGLLEGASLPPGVQSALRIADTEVRTTSRVDLAVDRVVVAIDEAIHGVLDDVLHHPRFQILEAAWRGLELAVEVASHHENVKLAVWHWTKDEIARDLAESSEVTKTRTFAEVYTAEYGVFGGEPYAAILGAMEFGPDAADVATLRGLAAIAAMAHAPFFAGASPGLLHLESWRDLPAVTEVRGVFDAPRFRAWNELRDNPDARYLGLLLPRYLAREPYTPSASGSPFGYTERVGSDAAGMLWGSPVFPLAARLTASFGRHGTLSALVGDDDDAPELPVRFALQPLGQRHVRPPLEAVVTDRLERLLRDVGFVTFVPRKGTTRVWLPSANTLQTRRTYGGPAEGREATLNYLLGTQFPYLLLVCRIAHYLKVIERDLLGASRTPLEITRALEEWLGQLSNAMDAITAEERARYPLRDAAVAVRSEEGDAGWLRADLQIRPQLRYLGSVFVLNLATRLEHRAPR